MIKIHKCALCDEARFQGGEFCEAHTAKKPAAPARKGSPCENAPACTNEAQSPFIDCLRCRWEHSEELYKADKLRREEEAKTEEAPAPTPEREEGRKANDPQWYIDRAKQKKKRHWGEK